MAYVRDDKTGKFAWVEGAVGGEPGDSAYVEPGKQPKSETSPTTLLIAVLIVGVLALVGIWGVKALNHPGVAIRRIHNHPAEFDGRQVILRGQVGSVFEVGGSYAYFLMQGRDTIVVFTRGARPESRRSAEVHGSVSIGYLDGVPRPALFQNAGTN